MPNDLHRTKRKTNRISLWKEVWRYLRVRKKWWLAPMLVILLGLGTVIVFTEGSVFAPFFYTLF
jgi:hypothetical protein